MKRQTLSIGLVAAAFTLSVGSAWAQDRGRPQGEQGSSRPSNGDTVGSAVPRGGGSDSGYKERVQRMSRLFREWEARLPGVELVERIAGRRAAGPSKV